MKNQMMRLAHLFFYGSLCVFLVGCDGKKNFVQDPDVNGSGVTLQIIETTYQQDTGVVKIGWLFSGDRDRGAFKIYRKESRGFQLIGSVKALPDVEKESGVVFYVDQTVYAGEKVIYQVVWENEAGILIYSNEAHANIPGAKIKPIKIDHASATAEVSWWPDLGDGSYYEVIRQVDEGPEKVVYQALSTDDRKYEDDTLIGNHTYLYYIKTTTSQGAVLKSRSVVSQFYNLAQSVQISNQLHTGIHLGIKNAGISNTGPVALLVGPHDIKVKQLPSYQQSAPDLIRAIPETALLDIGNLQPASLVYEGPYFRNPSSSGGQFVVGINSQTGFVEVRFYFLNGFGQRNAIKPMSWITEPTWDAMDSFTTVSRNSRNQLFFLTGNTIKMFKFGYFASDVAFFAQAEKNGHVLIDASTEPYDLFCTENFIWVSLPKEKRLLKGKMMFQGDTLVDVHWQDILLPEGASPGKLTINIRNQVFALDAKNPKIWVFNSEGQYVTYIDNLGEGFENGNVWEGDVIAGLYGGRPVLYLAKPSGTIQYYVTE